MKRNKNPKYKEDKKQKKYKRVLMKEGPNETTNVKFKMYFNYEI